MYTLNFIYQIIFYMSYAVHNTVTVYPIKKSIIYIHIDKSLTHVGNTIAGQYMKFPSLSSIHRNSLYPRVSRRMKIASSHE